MTGDGSFYPDPPGSQSSYHNPKSVISFHPVLEFNGNKNDFWLLFDDGDILQKHKSRPLKKPLKSSNAAASTSRPGFANTFTEATFTGGFMKPKDDDDVSQKSDVGKKKFADKCELLDDRKESRKEPIRERKRSDSRERRRSRSRDRDRRRSRSPARRRSPVRDRRYGDRSASDRRRSRSRDRKRSRSRGRDRSRSKDRFRRQGRDRRTSPNRGRRSMSISSSSSDGDSKSAKDTSEILKKFAEKLQEKAKSSSTVNKSLSSIRLNSRLEDTKHRRGIPITPIVFSLKKVPVKTLPGSAAAQKAEETAVTDPPKDKAPEAVKVEVNPLGSSVNTPLPSNIQFGVPPPLIPPPVSQAQPLRVTDGVTVACAPTLYKGGKQIPVSSSVISLPPPTQPPPVAAPAVNLSPPVVSHPPTKSHPMEAPKISEMHHSLAAQALEYAALSKVQEGMIPMGMEYQGMMRMPPGPPPGCPRPGQGMPPGMMVPGMMGPGPGMMGPNHYGPMGPSPHGPEGPFMPSFGPEGPFMGPPPHGPGGPFMGPPPGPDGPFMGPPPGPNGPFMGPPPGPDGPFMGPPPHGPEGPFFGPPPHGPVGPFMGLPPGGRGMQNPPSFFGPQSGPMGPPPRTLGPQSIDTNVSVNDPEKGNVTSAANMKTSSKAEKPTTTPSMVDKDGTTSTSNKPPPKPSHFGLEIANYQKIKPIVGVIKRLQYGKRYEHKSKSETSEYCLKRGLLCRVNQDLENPALVIVAPDDRSCRRRIVTALVLEYPDMDVDALIELFENSFHDMPMEDIEDVFEYESSRRREKLESKSSSHSKEQSKNEMADSKPDEVSTKVSSVAEGQLATSPIADKAKRTSTVDESGSSKADSGPSQTGPPSLEIANFEKLKFVVGLIKFLQTRSHLNEQIKSLGKSQSDEYCIKDGLLCKVKNECDKQVLVVVVPDDDNVRKTIVTAFVLKYPDLDVDGLIELFENTFDNMPVEDIEDVFENESTRRSSLLDSVESDFSRVESISSCGNVVLLCEGEQGSGDNAKSEIGSIQSKKTLVSKLNDPSKGGGDPTTNEKEVSALAVTELKGTMDTLPFCAVTDAVEPCKLTEKSVNDSDKIPMPGNPIAEDRKMIDENELGVAGDVASSQAALAESSAVYKENEGSSPSDPIVANEGAPEHQKSTSVEPISDDSSKVETEGASDSHLPVDIQEPEGQATQQTISPQESSIAVSDSEIRSKNVLGTEVINERSNIETSIVTSGGVVMEKSSHSVTKSGAESSSEVAAAENFEEQGGPISVPVEGYESVKQTVGQEVVDSENSERINPETATDSDAVKYESDDFAKDKPEKIATEAVSIALEPQECDEPEQVETTQKGTEALQFIDDGTKCDYENAGTTKTAEISSGTATAFEEGTKTSTEHGIMIDTVASMKVGHEADADAELKIDSTQSETTVVKGDTEQVKLGVQGVMSVKDKPEIAAEAVLMPLEPQECDDTPRVETTQKGTEILKSIGEDAKCDDHRFGETIDKPAEISSGTTTTLEEGTKTSTEHGIMIDAVASVEVDHETDADAQLKKIDSTQSETTLVIGDTEQVNLEVQGVMSVKDKPEIAAETVLMPLEPQECDDTEQVETTQKGAEILKSIGDDPKCDDNSETIDKLAEISSGTTTTLEEGTKTSTEHGIMIDTVASMEVDHEADADGKLQIDSTQSETTLVIGDTEQVNLEVQGVMSVKDKPEIAAETVLMPLEPQECDDTEPVETTQKGTENLQSIDDATKCNDNAETIDKLAEISSGTTTTLEEETKTTEHGIMIDSVASMADADAELKIGSSHAETTVGKGDTEQVKLELQGVTSDETPSEILSSCDINGVFKLAESDTSQMLPVDSAEVKDEAKRSSEGPASAGSNSEVGIGKSEGPLLIDKSEISNAVPKREPDVTEVSRKSVDSEALDTATHDPQEIKTESISVPTPENHAVLTRDLAVEAKPDIEMEFETDECTEVKIEPITTEVVKSESIISTKEILRKAEVPPQAEPVKFKASYEVTEVKMEIRTTEVDVSEVIKSESIISTKEIPRAVEVPPQAKPIKFKSTYELMKSVDFGEPKEVYSEPDPLSIVNYDKLSFFATRLIEIQKDSDIAAITSKITFVSYDASDQFVMKSGLLCKRKDLETNEVFIVLLKSTSVYREIVSALTEQYPDLDFNEFMSLIASSFLYITPAEIKSLIEKIDGKATSIKYQSFIERCKLVNYDIICNMQDQLKAMQKADSTIMYRYNRLKSNNCVDDSYILKLDLVCQFTGTIDFKVCLPKSQPDQIAIMYIVHESNHNKNLIEFLELLRATFDGVNVSLIDRSVALCSTCRPPATARASSMIKACEQKCPALKSLPPEVIFKIRQVQMASSVYKAQIELLTKGQSRQGGRYILDTSLLCKAMTKGEEPVYRVVVSPSSLKDVVSLLHTTYHRKALSEFVPFVNEFLAVTEEVCKAAIQECNICANKTLKNLDARKSPSPKKSHDEVSRMKSPEPSKKENQISSKDKARTSSRKETETKKPAISKKDSNEASKSAKDSSKRESSRDAYKESCKEQAKSPRRESSKETTKDGSKRESSRESTKAGAKREYSKESSTKAGSKRESSKESKTPEPEKSKTKEHEKIKPTEPAKTLRGERIRNAVIRDLWRNERIWGRDVVHRIKYILRSLPDKVLSDVIDRQKSCPVLMEIRKDAERSKMSSDAKGLVCGDIVFSLKSKAFPKVAVKPIKNINYILITQIHAEAHDWTVNKIVGTISNTFDVTPSVKEVEATIDWFCTKCQKPGSSKPQKIYGSLDERLQDFYQSIRITDKSDKGTPSKSDKAPNESECEAKTELTDEISKQIAEDLKVLGNVRGSDLVNKIIAVIQPIPYKLRKDIIDRQRECVELVDIIESLEPETPEKDARHVLCGGILFVIKSKKKVMQVKIHVKPIGSKNINYILITQMHAAYHDWSFNKIFSAIGASFDVSPSVVEIAVTVEWFCSNCRKPDMASKEWASLGDQLKDFYSNVDPLLIKEKSKEEDDDDDDQDIDLTQEIPVTDVRIALAKLPSPVVSKIQIAQMASQVLKTQIVLLEKNKGPAKGKGYCLVMSLLCKLVKLDDKLAWRVMIPTDMLKDLVIELHTVHYHDMIQEDFFEFVSSFMTVSEDLVNELFATCALCLTTVRRAPTLCERGINEDLVRKTLAMIAEMIDFVIKWQTETPAIAKIRDGVKKVRQEAVADYILYKDILFKVSGKSKGGKPPRPKIAVSLLPNALDEVIKSTHAFYHSNNQNQLMNLINVCFDVTVPRNLLSTKIPELCKICGKKSDVQNVDDDKNLADTSSAGESINDTADSSKKGSNVGDSPGVSHNIADGASTSDQPEPKIKAEGEEPTPLGVLLLGRLCDQVIEESSNSSRALDSPVSEIPQTDTRPVIRQVPKIILQRCVYDPKILQTVEEGTTRKRKTETKKPPAKRARKTKLTKIKEEPVSAQEDSASGSESSLPKRKFVVYSSESETDCTTSKTRKRKATGSTSKAKKPRE